MTVVLQNGAAITMPWAGDVTAILESYLAGEAVGEATWDVLTGAVNPSGKLAESFPVYLGDNPATLFFNADAEKEDYREGIFVGYRYYDTKELEVRFPFGHGMSYTDFAYDDLQVEELADTVKVTATVKNIGDRAGKEVVQLYVVNEASRVAMPAHELRGFEKVSLAPGEATTVTFELDRRAFSWYNAANEQWQADNGHYEIQVGSSSRDIRLQAPLELTLGQTRQPVITADSYLDDIEASADPVVQIAFEQSGLKAAVQPLLDNPATVKIMENLPLRVLVTAGGDDVIVQKFLNLVLCG
ncbi:beta-glucosidase [Limosilactobacillus ingluviei]|uniref:Beta-glucosidase n=1 Tax=Limosilactobacillus ingluviei TaxID=148604 RepID=A0A0R2GS10_9LACO|nr:beta-glucosidase [Limosilactobacillus ingluviei]